MKLHVLSEHLQKKLPLINKAVSLKGQLPVLSNVLLEAKGGKLIISSTDLEIGIQTEIPANIEQEGGTTVPAKTFSELIASLPSDKITLELIENTLKVSTKKTKSTLQTIPKEEFPAIYEEKGEKVLVMKKGVLQKDFAEVLFAASNDTSRPALSGILIKKEENGFLLVATDGYRLSLKKQATAMENTSDGGVQEAKFLIPARVFKELHGLKEAEDIAIYIAGKSNQIILDQGHTLIVGRMIDADFPAYERIIPTSSTTKVVFDKEEMQKAIKICAIFARETANIVRFTVKKDTIIVSANTPNVGDNTVEVEATLTGDENEVAFNARYLLDFFANIEEETIAFEMSGPLNPGVFRIKDDNSYLHIIMPIRVQSSGELA